MERGKRERERQECERTRRMVRPARGRDGGRRETSPVALGEITRRGARANAHGNGRPLLLGRCFFIFKCGEADRSRRGQFHLLLSFRQQTNQGQRSPNMHGSICSLVWAMDFSNLGPDLTCQGCLEAAVGSKATKSSPAITLNIFCRRSVRSRTCYASSSSSLFLAPLIFSPRCRSSPPPPPPPVSLSRGRGGAGEGVATYVFGIASNFSLPQSAAHLPETSIFGSKKSDGLCFFEAEMILIKVSFSGNLLSRHEISESAFLFALPSLSREEGPIHRGAHLTEPPPLLLPPPGWRFNSIFWEGKKPLKLEQDHFLKGYMYQSPTHSNFQGILCLLNQDCPGSTEVKPF